MDEEDRPVWQDLFFDSDWAEFHEQPEGSPTEGMVPLFAGHKSVGAETTEYEATVEGFAPDEATARLWGLADAMAAMLRRINSDWEDGSDPDVDAWYRALGDVSKLVAQLDQIEDDARTEARAQELASDPTEAEVRASIEATRVPGDCSECGGRRIVLDAERGGTPCPACAEGGHHG